MQLGESLKNSSIFSQLRCFLSFIFLSLPRYQGKEMRMEKLIGRKNETDKLSSYMQSDRSEFIAIYGRRRVGKTFLVRSFFKDKFDFYATGIIEGNKSEEMES